MSMSNRFRLQYAPLIVTLMVIYAAAQERPLPPTRITLPSDTLAARRAPAKLEADSSRIELPDVVVLGQDRSVRQVESKRGSRDDQPRLIRPDYESFSIFSRRDNSRPLLRDAAAARERLIWAGASAGSFSALVANGGYSGKFPWGSARFSGWFDRADGPYDNSQHADGGLFATATTPLRPQLHGRAQAEQNWLSRGLHGAVHPDLTRSARQSSVQGEAQFAIDPLSSARAGLQLGGASVTSDTSGRKWQHSSDFVAGVHGDYIRQMGRHTLRAAAVYNRDSFSAVTDSLDAVVTFREIRAELQTSLLSSVQLTTGLGYQNCKTGRLAPSLRLAYIPNNHWGLSLAAWAGLRYSSYNDRLSENPYSSHSLSLAADDSPLSLQLRADYRLAGTMLFQAGLFHGRYDLLNYWQRDAVTGLIDLQQVKEVRLTEMQVSGRIGLRHDMMLHGEILFNNDQLKRAVSSGDENRIPYRPDFRARASLAMPLSWQLQLTAETEIIGQRRRGLDRAGRLPAYALLNAALRRTFGKQFSANLSVRNLLDRDYVVWEGYDEPGIQIMAGIRWIY